VEIQNVRLLQEMGIQTWIGRRSIRGTYLPNLFMIELVVNCDAINQEDLTNLQDDTLQNGDEGRSIFPRKRRRLSMDKETCWELAAEAQNIVNAETLYNIEESNGEKNVCEEDDQDPQDFWKDINCLQFL
jgi:hypothetical protein